mgnify:CR=1 FL=1
MEYLKVQLNSLLINRKNIITHFSSSPLAHIRSIAHTEIDESFINKLDKIIYENLTNYNLNVDTLAEQMNMSRSTLYRKISDLSNLSPNELINITRLKRAAELLQSNDHKMYEISDLVGYKAYTNYQRKS